jgi:hypothetical protein
MREFDLGRLIIGDGRFNDLDKVLASVQLHVGGS